MPTFFSSSFSLSSTPSLPPSLPPPPYLKQQINHLCQIQGQRRSCPLLLLQIKQGQWPKEEIVSCHSNIHPEVFHSNHRPPEGQVTFACPSYLLSSRFLLGHFGEEGRRGGVLEGGDDIQVLPQGLKEGGRGGGGEGWVSLLASCFFLGRLGENPPPPSLPPSLLFSPCPASPPAKTPCTARAPWRRWASGQRQPLRSAYACSA